jgi:molecular chaperone DnaJ
MHILLGKSIPQLLFYHLIDETCPLALPDATSRGYDLHGTDACNHGNFVHLPRRSMRNLYEILGVDKDADQDTIRKAYRRLAKKYHPDRASGEENAEHFREVTQAYEVLGDETRRGLYNQYGDIALNPNFKGLQPGEGQWGADYKFGDFGGFDQFFNGFTDGTHGTQEYRGSGQEAGRPPPSSGRSRGSSWDYSRGSSSDFGSGGRSSRSTNGFEPPEKGTDIKLSLQIGLVEALRGCDKRVRVRRATRWNRGSTAGMTEEKVVAQIPAGVQSGYALRLKGKGNPGKGGGASGDLVVTIEVGPHPHLFREGADLFLNVPLTLFEAMQGCQLVVPTLNGSVRVKVPPGVSPGQKLRLKGRGASKSTGGNGDMYIILRPTPPDSRDPKVAELAKELEAYYAPGGIRKDLKI